MERPSQKPFYDFEQFEQDAFRGVEVQVCGETRTVKFSAWDHGGHDNEQSAALSLEDAKKLIAWLQGAIAKVEAQ